jgi:hypothetical protein
LLHSLCGVWGADALLFLCKCHRLIVFQHSICTATSPFKDLSCHSASPTSPPRPKHSLEKADCQFIVRNRYYDFYCTVCRRRAPLPSGWLLWNSKTVQIVTQNNCLKENVAPPVTYGLP